MYGPIANKQYKIPAHQILGRESKIQNCPFFTFSQKFDQKKQYFGRSFQGCAVHLFLLMDQAEPLKTYVHGLYYLNSLTNYFHWVVLKHVNCHCAQSYDLFFLGFRNRKCFLFDTAWFFLIFYKYYKMYKWFLFLLLLLRSWKVNI